MKNFVKISILSFLLISFNDVSTAQNFPYVYVNESFNQNGNRTIKIKASNKRELCFYGTGFHKVYGAKISGQIEDISKFSLGYDIWHKRNASAVCNYTPKIPYRDERRGQRTFFDNLSNIPINSQNKISHSFLSSGNVNYTIKGNVTLKLPNPKYSFVEISSEKLGCNQTIGTDLCTGTVLEFTEIGMSKVFKNNFSPFAAKKSADKTIVHIEYNLNGNTQKRPSKTPSYREFCTITSPSSPSFISEGKKLYSSSSDCNNIAQINSKNGAKCICKEEFPLEDELIWKMFSTKLLIGPNNKLRIDPLSIPEIKNSFTTTKNVSLRFRVKYKNNKQGGESEYETKYANIGPEIILRPTAPEFGSINGIKVEKPSGSPNYIPIVIPAQCENAVSLSIKLKNQIKNSNFDTKSLFKIFLQRRNKVDKCKSIVKKDEQIDDSNESLKNLWFAIGDSYIVKDFDKPLTINITKQINALKSLSDIKGIPLDLLIQNSDGNGVCTNAIPIYVQFHQKPFFEQTPKVINLACRNSNARISGRINSTAPIVNNEVILKSKGSKIGTIKLSGNDTKFDKSFPYDLLKEEVNFTLEVKSTCDDIVTYPITINRPESIKAINKSVDLLCNKDYLSKITIGGFDGGTSKNYNVRLVNTQTNKVIDTKTSNNAVDVVLEANAIGLYHVEVRNTNQLSCDPFKLDNIRLINLPPISIQEVVGSKIDNQCFDNTNGSISFKIPNSRKDLNYDVVHNGMKISNNVVPENGEVAINSLKSGVYQMRVYRNNSCKDQKTYDFTIDAPSKMEVTVNTARVSCSQAGDGKIILHIKNGNINNGYRVSLKPPQGKAQNFDINTNDLIIPDLAAGAYEVLITNFDDKGQQCFHDQFNQTITVPDVKPVTAQFSPVSFTCLNPNNADLTISQIQGGDDRFDIEVLKDKAIFVKEVDYTNNQYILNDLAPGKYTITISDHLRADCQIYQESFEIKPLALLDFDIKDNQDIACWGESTGFIEVSTKNENAILSLFQDGFFVKKIDILNAQKSYFFNDLPAGKFEVVLERSLITCLENKRLAIELTQPFEPLSILKNISHVVCEGESNGQIDLTIKGGTKPYEFVWFKDGNLFKKGSTADASLTDLFAGKYSLEIVDGNNCKLSDKDIEITEPKKVTADINIVATGCEAPLDAAIQIENLQGGDNLYNIKLLKEGELLDEKLNYTQSFYSFNNLLPGNYSILINDVNRINCPAIDEDFEISKLVDLFILQKGLNNITCFNQNDGFASFILSGSTNYYFKLLRDNNFYQEGDTKSILFWDDLPKGSYNLKIYRSRTCDTVAEYDFSIAEPEQLSILGEEKNITRFGKKDGKINISVEGGWGEYSITWKKDNRRIRTDETLNLTNLSKGKYTAIVKDKGGCQLESSSFTIEEPEPLQFIDLEEKNKICNQDKFFVNLEPTVKGGWPPYQFEMSINDGNWQPVNFENPVEEGDLKFKVIDRYGNEIEFAETLSYLKTEGPLTLNPIAKEVNGYNIACFGDFTGELTMQASGGAKPYKYQLNNEIWTTNPIFTNLPFGEHKATIEDANGCQVQQTIRLTSPELLEFDQVKTKGVKCFGDYSGEIALSFVGGVEPYSVKIDNFEWKNELFFDQLTAQDYLITVKDKNNCQATKVVNIQSLNEPILLNASVQNVSCPKEANGSITLNPVGGQPPYQYKWEDNSTEKDRNKLPTGGYKVLLTDVEGCQAQEAFEIIEPEIVLLPEDKILCKDQSITLDASHQNGKKYQWYFNGKKVSDKAKNTFTSAGEYEVKITLENDCQISDTFKFESADIDFSASFLIATYGVKGDTLQLIENSSSLPDHIEWSFDDELEVGKDAYGQPWVTSTKPGLYKVSMESFYKGCSSISTKFIEFNASGEATELINDKLFANKGIEEVILNPNPNNGVFSIKVIQKTEEPIDIKITSNDRIEVFSKRYDPSKEAVIDVNIANQASGIYIVIVRAGLSQKAIRVILRR